MILPARLVGGKIRTEVLSLPGRTAREMRKGIIKGGKSSPEYADAHARREYSTVPSEPIVVAGKWPGKR